MILGWDDNGDRHGIDVVMMITMITMIVMMV